MAAVVAVIIGTAALVAVLLPFVVRRAGERREAGDGGAELQHLLDRRDTLVRGLRELDYDRQLGNLSAEDHDRLWAGLERQAIATLKAIDARAGRVPDEIEAEVREAREAWARARQARERSPEGRPESFIEPSGATEHSSG